MLARLFRIALGLHIFVVPADRAELGRIAQRIGRGLSPSSHNYRCVLRALPNIAAQLRCGAIGLYVRLPWKILSGTINMALVLTGTFLVAPPPKALVESNIVGSTAPTFTMRMFTFGVGFIVTPTLPGTPIDGKSVPDFPPTPSAPEPWVLGCVQNVISQRIDITWVDDSGNENSEFTSTGQMLDADPDVAGQMQHLPFVRVSNGSGVPPSSMALLYGLPGTPTIPVALPAGAGPAWDIATGGTGPFGLASTDAPAIEVFAFKGGGAVSGSSNPIIEVSRSITLQVWLTAVRIGNIGDASKHNILGYTNAFTLKGKYNRRSNPTDAGFVHFEPSDFTHDPITTTPNTGNKSPPSRLPIVSGQLSVAPVVAFLRDKGYSR